VSPVRECINTAALLLLYCCFTSAERMRVSPVRECLHTAALLLLYCCFTWAYLHPSQTLEPRHIQRHCRQAERQYCNSYFLHH
jgi:hypothetical protein